MKKIFTVSMLFSLLRGIFYINNVSRLPNNIYLQIIYFEKILTGILVVQVITSALPTQFYLLTSYHCVATVAIYKLGGRTF